MLNLVFAQADKDISRKTALHRRQYIRLTDKALDEYNEARLLILAQVEVGSRTTDEMTSNGRGIYMFKFIDHMENCISSVRRALRYLEYIKGNQDGLQVPKLIRKQINSLSTSLVDVRNFIEHMDEKIQNNEIQENEPVMMKLIDTQDGVTIAGRTLKFSTLSIILVKLQEFGKDLAAWNVEDTGS